MSKEIKYVEGNIEATIRYQVFELDENYLATRERMRGDQRRINLIKVDFKDYRSNDFDSMEEAIKAMIDDKMNGYDYVILPTIDIRQV